ncbi:hypothetical protein ACJX0J_031262, partial [Zea mays]
FHTTTCSNEQQQIVSPIINILDLNVFIFSQLFSNIIVGEEHDLHRKGQWTLELVHTKIDAQKHPNSILSNIDNICFSKHNPSIKRGSDDIVVAVEDDGHMLTIVLNVFLQLDANIYDIFSFLLYIFLCFAIKKDTSI